MKREYGKIANETRKKRLKFRAWHRGTREADLLIGSFADLVLPTLDESGLDQFEDLLQCNDPDIYDWMTGRLDPPIEHDNEIMRQLKEFKFAHSRDKEA
jgi:antitoxin CptB